jgi:hypothetical protein
MKNSLILSVIALATALSIPGCSPSTGFHAVVPVLSITTQPANVSVALGSTATFTVVPGGPAPFSYQWSRDGAPISGATSSSFTTAPTTAADNGAVFVVTVTDAQSSVTSLPATLTVGGTSATSLVKGQYAFSYSGENAAGPISILGSFTTDGNGNITAGIEDITSVKTGSATVATEAAITMTGTYTVGNDGRGTTKWITSADRPQNFAFVIEGGNRGQLTWSDATAGGSGSFDLQDPAVLAAGAPGGGFAFALNGVDPAANMYSRVGVFTAANGLVASGGESDVNDAFGAGGVNLAQTISAGSISAPDHTSGRGTLSLSYAGSAVQYIYYAVSASELNLISADGTASVSGTATLQSGGPFSSASLKGNYVYSIQGGKASTIFAEAGQFTADGMGGLIGVGDQNIFSIPKTGFTLTGSFATVAPNGRGTMQLAFPSFNPLDPEYVFYIASNNIIYLMETDTTQVSSGQAMAQTGGPYTTASLAGTYGIQFAGGQLTSEVAASGQLVAGGTGTLSGTLDLNQVAAPASGPPVFSFSTSAIAQNSADAVTGSTTGRGTFSVTGAFPAQFSFYFVSPTEFVAIDTIEVAIGSGQAQSANTP